jgi:hypothetical protein
MDSERWHEVDGLFAAALERPPAERAAFLTHTAGDVLAEAEGRGDKPPPGLK